MIYHLDNVNVSLIGEHLHLDFANMTNKHESYVLNDNSLSEYKHRFGGNFFSITIENLACNTLYIDFNIRRLSIVNSNLAILKTSNKSICMNKLNVSTLYLDDAVNTILIMDTNIQTIRSNFIHSMAIYNTCYIDSICMNYLYSLSYKSIGTLKINQIHGFVSNSTANIHCRESINMNGKRIMNISDRLEESIYKMNSIVLSYIISINV